MDRALLTDLYEFTMTEAYLAEGLSAEAVFSLFVRRLPPRRNYLLASGLCEGLAYLEQLRFSPAELGFLASTGKFSDRLLRYLERFRFTGEVHAVPEGTPVFAQEPLLEVVAPLPEAQLIETLLMNQLHLETLGASKAARVVAAARGRAVVDFGARRMHGLDAAVKVARAAYVAGVEGTSNVLAGQRYGIPVFGTMAHSYVQAHDDELGAFRAFLRTYPDATLLVDTYDTLEGVRKVIRLAEELGPSFAAASVRLDSGDLLALAKGSRRLLDEAGLFRVGIFASGGLDEDEVERLLEAGAPIDGFGVGTAMGVSEDAPSLDIAYKLVSYGGVGRLKLSPGKGIFPGRKQVFRVERDGVAHHDVLASEGEALEGRPLLRAVMRAGQRLERKAPAECVSESRARASRELSLLPVRVRGLEPAAPPYEVLLSGELRRRRDQAAAAHSLRERRM